MYGGVPAARMNRELIRHTVILPKVSPPHRDSAPSVSTPEHTEPRQKGPRQSWLHDRLRSENKKCYEHLERKAKKKSDESSLQWGSNPQPSD
jgi:hypothetical protein